MSIINYRYNLGTGETIKTPVGGTSSASSACSACSAGAACCSAHASSAGSAGNIGSVGELGINTIVSRFLTGNMVQDEVVAGLKANGAEVLTVENKNGRITIRYVYQDKVNTISCDADAAASQVDTKTATIYSANQLKNTYKFSDDIINKYFDEAKKVTGEVIMYSLKDDCGYKNVTELQNAIFTQYKNDLILDNFMNGCNRCRNASIYLSQLDDGKYLTKANYTTYIDKIDLATGEDAEKLRQDAVNKLIADFSNGDLAYGQVSTILNAIGVTNKKQKLSNGVYTISFTFNNKNYSVSCSKEYADKGTDDLRVHRYTDIVPGGYMRINTTDEFITLIKNNPSGKFVLMANLDFEGVDMPVRLNFTGTLEGNNYTISGLSKALFATVSGANIQNVNLTESTSQNGLLAETMRDCTVENINIDDTCSGKYGLFKTGALVLVENCTVNGNYTHGAIAGSLTNGTITNSTVLANVTGDAVLVAEGNDVRVANTYAPNAGDTQVLVNTDKNVDNPNYVFNITSSEADIFKTADVNEMNNAAREQGFVATSYRGVYTETVGNDKFYYVWNAATKEFESLIDVVSLNNDGTYKSTDGRTTKITNPLLLAAVKGYTQSETEGVFVKGENIYKYDAETNDFVEVSKSDLLANGTIHVDDIEVLKSNIDIPSINANDVLDMMKKIEDFLAENNINTNDYLITAGINKEGNLEYKMQNLANGETINVEYNAKKSKVEFKEYDEKDSKTDEEDSNMDETGKTLENTERQEPEPNINLDELKHHLSWGYNLTDLPNVYEKDGKYYERIETQNANTGSVIFEYKELSKTELVERYLEKQFNTDFDTVTALEAENAYEITYKDIFGNDCTAVIKFNEETKESELVTDQKEIEQLRHGYTKTNLDDVYEKDNKYYEWDEKTNKYTEIDEMDVHENHLEKQLGYSLNNLQKTETEDVYVAKKNDGTEVVVKFDRNTNTGTIIEDKTEAEALKGAYKQSDIEGIYEKNNKFYEFDPATGKMRETNTLEITSKYVANMLAVQLEDGVSVKECNYNSNLGAYEVTLSNGKTGYAVWNSETNRFEYKDINDSFVKSYGQEAAHAILSGYNRTNYEHLYEKNGKYYIYCEQSQEFIEVKVSED